MGLDKVLEKKSLAAGCNYWASHAGIYMWRQWREDIVEKDLQILAQHNMNTIRVFPLWPDFQPVHLLRGCAGEGREYAFKGERSMAPDSDGMDPVMLERFRILADLAEKYDLKLIVGLLTGWMSGRLFVPPVLEGRDLFSDGESLRWESRFIRTFVKCFKDHKAIIAWEPGNECNCLSRCKQEDLGATSYHWADFIANTIRAVDNSRPVYSGLHGCSPQMKKNWNLFMLGEIFDALTTHPYPLFTPHCGKSALPSLPAVLHSTAETLFYEGISCKPAFVEEIGTLGPCMLSEEKTAAYMRIALLSAYVHGHKGFFWWCAFDQDHLDYPPYTWVALERELGLFHGDRTPHPAAAEMKKTLDALEKLPFAKLPPRKIDALVIPGSMEEKWKCAYGAFLLAKQSGFEVSFHAPDRPELPESSFYWLPAIDCLDVLCKSQYHKLLEKVKEGASLLITDVGRGFLQPFKSVSGCEIQYTALQPQTKVFHFEGVPGEISINNPYTRKILPETAQVLIYDNDGNALLTVNGYGKGKVFYLNCAPEMAVLDEKIPQWYLVYRMIAAKSGMVLPEKSPWIGRTLHGFSDAEQVEILLNYGDHDVDGIPADSMLVKTSDTEILIS